MRHEITVVGKTALEYLDKYPNTASLTIARIMRKEQPEIFATVEAARTVIRHYRGAMGKESRESVKVKTHLADTPRVSVPKMPESVAEMYTPYEIPGGLKSALILADVHIPYHDKNAVELAVIAGKAHGVDCVVLDGDIWDMHTLSRYCKDPRARNFKSERDDVIAFLAYLRYKLPRAKIIYKQGNHERRYEDYLMLRAAEIYGCEEYQIPTLLKLGESGIDWVADKRIIKYDKLNILHGDEFQTGMISPVNPARGAFLRTKDITLVAHSHRTSEHTETTIGEKIITCWSVGCLCYLHPAYNPNNNWNHGYAVVEFSGADDWHIRNHRIYGGRTL